MTKTQIRRILVSPTATLYLAFFLTSWFDHFKLLGFEGIDIDFSNPRFIAFFAIIVFGLVAVARYFFAKDKAEFALYGDLASGYMAYFTLGAFSGSAEIRIASIIASLVIVACTIDSSTRLAKTLGKIFAPIAILCFLLVLLGMGLRS